MKKFFLLLTTLLLSGYINAQDISDEFLAKSDITSLVGKLVKENKVTNEVILVLDEQLVLNPKEITNAQHFQKEVKVIEKGHQDMVEIYGDAAINGIIFITSIPLISPQDKVVYMLGDKEISKEELSSINPKNIKSIDVKKSTQDTGVVEGVIRITLKD